MSAAPPIIDIGPLLDGTGPGSAGAAAEIHRACLGTGFFVAVGHGLDVEMAGVFASAERFFALPQADKETVPRLNRYGYVPRARDAIDTDRESGLTEYLDIGLGDEVPLPAVAGLEAAVRTYQRRALDVAAALLRPMAASLGAEPDYFASRMTRPQCRLRFIRYRPEPLGPEGVRPVTNSPHTDYGLVTLLATDGVPGLEVRPRDAGWVAVVAPPGSIVVNLGDMLARWTNDIYVSTPHRVVGGPDTDRLSVPFFVNPDPHAEVACIPGCVTDDRPCRYQPVRAGAYLAARIDGHAEPYVDPSEGPTRTADR